MWVVRAFGERLALVDDDCTRTLSLIVHEKVSWLLAPFLGQSGVPLDARILVCLFWQHDMIDCERWVAGS